MGRWRRRLRRAVQVTRVAGHGRILRVLGELGVVGEREATAESAHEFRLSLEQLGTTYIKLGQLLSSRPDLLPDVYIEELGKLVDDVPPVPFAELEDVIRSDVGPDTFARIDPEPLAAASIAQIHVAILKDGRDVVIKARRPGILEQVNLDLDLLRSAVSVLERRSETARMLQLGALADELETHLRAELDFVEEANNTEVIARLVDDYEDLVVPAVVRPYVTDRVLVLERIHGRKLAAGHGLEPGRAAGLARTFFRAYVRQVTVAGIYHADPHRGNVLLTEDGRLGLLDFGLLGRLDDDSRRTLSLLLMALAQNRADDVAQLILELSLTTLASDQAAFVHDVRRKLPRYHWRPLSGIRAGEALADLQRIALAHGIRLPTSFALVGKTLSQADSIAAHARSRARSGRAAGGGRARGDPRRGRAPARPQRPPRLRVHAGRLARPAPSQGRARRRPPRDGDAQGRDRAHRPRPARRARQDVREQARGGDHHRRPARLLGADGAGGLQDRDRGLPDLGDHRDLRDLADRAHTGRHLGSRGMTAGSGVRPP